MFKSCRFSLEGWMASPEAWKFVIENFVETNTIFKTADSDSNPANPEFRIRIRFQFFWNWIHTLHDLKVNQQTSLFQTRRQKKKRMERGAERRRGRARGVPAPRKGRRRRKPPRTRRKRRRRSGRRRRKRRRKRSQVQYDFLGLDLSCSQKC